MYVKQIKNSSSFDFILVDFGFFVCAGNQICRTEKTLFFAYKLNLVMLNVAIVFFKTIWWGNMFSGT